MIYVSSLKQIACWAFAFDHIHYARWLPVHIRDMIFLHTKHPRIYKYFQDGNFAVAVTNRKFSSVSIDQAHEMQNKIVKGDGGIIGVTDNQEFLNRWLICAPEVTRLLHEFEYNLCSQPSNASKEHHENNLSFQTRFSKDIQNLNEAIIDSGNPFSNSSKDLITLETGFVSSEESIKVLYKIEAVGIEQYKKYFEGRLLNIDHTNLKYIYDKIEKNKFLIFDTNTKSSRKKQTSVKTLKQNYSLFSKLFIASQTRDVDLIDLFSHENHTYPPALSSDCTLSSAEKAQLVKCLESNVNNDLTTNTTMAQTTTTDVTTTKFDIILLEGQVMVNMIKPENCTTFEEYAERNIIPYIESYFKNVSQIDLIWDVYHDKSLKNITHKKRGTSFKRIVSNRTSLPSNWAAFLKNNFNKTELSIFLANYVVNYYWTNKEVLIVSTLKDNVITNLEGDFSNLQNCNHEEADTRIFLHLVDAIRNEACTFLIRTVDTDVVVLSVYAASIFPLTKIYVAFGKGSSFRYITSHTITSSIGYNKSQCLPIFHSFTGCDTTSHFVGKGKKICWQIWDKYPDISNVFLKIMLGGELE